MTKKGYIKFLGLLLVVGLLFAALPTGQAQAAAIVTTEAELRNALAGTETQIELGASFTLTATVEVNRTVSIDGKGYIISGPPKGAEAHQGHGLAVYANNVHISNLTITGSGRSNLNFYVATGGVVNNVVLSNAANAGMIVNGSVVTISNVTTSGNTWGGINVDQGSGVTEIPLLTVTNVTHHTSPVAGITPAIWVDKGYADWVSAAGLYIVRPGTPLAFFDIAEFTEAFPVHNVTQDTYFTTIQAAIAAAVAGDTINVAPGEYVEVGQIVIDKNLTIVGADKATTIIKPAQDTGNGGDARGWFLVNAGVQFNLSNVTLDGAGKLVSIGILSHGTGTIENNIIKNIGYNPSGPDYAGRGIAIYDADMTIKNNLLQNIGRIGIYVYGTNADLVVIDGNTYEGKGAGNWLDYGVEIEGGAQAEVKNNLIKNCTGIASVDSSGSAGLLITTYFASGSTANIHDNEFNGNSVGIAVGYNETDTSLVVAQKNKILGDGTAIVSTNPAVNASPNWYGSMADPSAKISGAAVDYSPWCANAGCTEFLPGAVTIAPVTPVVCGNTPTTTIDVNISGIPASIVAQGYQLTLHFDPAKTMIANAADIVQGGFLPVGTGFQVLTIDNVTGTVEIASAIMGPATNDSAKPLVKITLTHKGVAGNIDLLLSDVLLSDADGFPIPTEVSTTPVVLTLQPAVLNITKDPDVGYCTLAEAVAGAAGGDNLQLMAHIISNVTITVDKALTLDTNSLTISRTVVLPSNNSFVVAPGGDLTITGGGTITSTSGNAIRIEGNADTQAKVTLVNATLYAPNTSVSIIGNRSSTAHEPAYKSLFVMIGGYTNETVLLLGNGAEANITGGTLTGYAPIMGNGTVDAVTNNGGTIITIGGTAVVNGNTNLAIYHPQDGLLTINGGTITGTNGIEMKAGNLVVTGGTILGTGEFADPLPNDNGSADTGDAILLNGRDAYTGDITVNISGGIITSTNAYALRDYKAADQALKTSAVLVSGGTFSGGIQAVTFSDEFVALPRTATTGLMLTGGLYNTDPADPDVFVFVPYGTVYNGTMYEIVGISLNVHDFYYANYDTGHGILRGVSTDFTVTNFVFADATSVTVQLFSGTEGAYVLQQTNTLKTPASFNISTLTSSFDIFGTYVSNSWANTRQPEFGQTVAPTHVEVTVVLPGGTLTGSSNILTGDRTTILPGVSGLVTLQGILAPRAGVQILLTSGAVVRDAFSLAQTVSNYSFTGVETLTYTFTTHQLRYLNVTTASGKTLLVNGDKVLNSLRLYGGDVDQNNAIGLSDASTVGSDWGSTLNPESNINYDGIVNIQDLALVGGNYGLTSADAYGWWFILP